MLTRIGTLTLCPFKKKFEEFKTEMKKNSDASEAAHKTAIDKFSPEAKAADAKLTKIATDKGLVRRERFLNH